MTIANPGGGARAFVYAPRGKSGSAAKEDESNKYARLFSVAITHNYYTQQDGRCADFRIVPTDETASVMASLGLVLKNEGAGFSVFYTPASLKGIFDYVRREAQEDPAGTPGFWSRLTFLMQLVNPDFVAVTALPIDTKMAEVNLYGCNLHAHGDPKAAVLSEGEYMGAGALRPVVGAEYTVEVPLETEYVTVTDISGAVAIPASAEEKEKKVIQFYSGPDAKYAMIDFSIVPYDLYTIHVFGKDWQPIEKDGFPSKVLYVPPGAWTMGLLDMLFTQPTRETKGGIYPIPAMFDGDPDPAKCGHVAYQLPFDARHTYWQYFVAPQVPGGDLVDVTIEGPGATFVSEGKVWLPDGSHADKFTSSDPLAMRQKSARRFQLKGRRLDPNGQSNAVRLLRLPVAPAAPVWPAPKDRPSAPNTTGTSEMFVYV